MCKIFIDESGVHLPPDNVWTFCCLRGEEKAINKIHAGLLEKMVAQWSNLKLERKLHYTEFNSKQKEYALSYLNKYNLDFTIIYCDKDTASCFPDCKTDEMKRYMIQQLLLDRVDKEHTFKAVYLDKSPLSKKSIKKLRRVLSELNLNNTVIPVPSRVKPGLQIADILTGAARQYILNKKHKKIFDENKEKILLLQEIYGILKTSFNGKANTTVESSCFKF